METRLGKGFGGNQSLKSHFKRLRDEVTLVFSGPPLISVTVVVSTVYLEDSVYETMVTGDELNTLLQQRYKTREEAVFGHSKMVIDLCSGKYRLKPAGFELIGPTHDNIGDKKVE